MDTALRFLSSFLFSAITGANFLIVPQNFSIAERVPIQNLTAIYTRKVQHKLDFSNYKAWKSHHLRSTLIVEGLQ